MAPDTGPQRRPPTPASFGALVGRFHAEPTEPGLGQIWRARWQNTAQLIALTAVDDDRISAVPVSFDVALADDQGVLLPPESVLGEETVAWMSLSRELPVRVLDVLVGHV